MIEIHMIWRNQGVIPFASFEISSEGDLPDIELRGYLNEADYEEGILTLRDGGFTHLIPKIVQNLLDRGYRVKGEDILGWVLEPGDLVDLRTIQERLLAGLERLVDENRESFPRDVLEEAYGSRVYLSDSFWVIPKAIEVFRDRFGIEVEMASTVPHLSGGCWNLTDSIGDRRKKIHTLWEGGNEKEMAFEMCRHDAREGDTFAMWVLGLMYRYYGNEMKSLHWLRESADGGDETGGYLYKSLTQRQFPLNSERDAINLLRETLYGSKAQSDLSDDDPLSVFDEKFPPEESICTMVNRHKISLDPR